MRSLGPLIQYGASQVKNPPPNAGDVRDQGLIPGSGRSPGEGNGKPIQYSYLGNPVDRGPWQATVHGVTRVGHDLATKLLGARVRHSARGKGHEEGGSIYAKAGSSLRSPPGNPRASTPITRACLLYYFLLSPTPLTLRGAVPHHLFQRRS